MKTVGILSFVLFMHDVAPATVSRNCLDAICKVESFGCNNIGCRMDGHSEACGYYQIHQSYYKDCNTPGTGWKPCSLDKACAEGCIQAYMRRYAEDCTGTRTPTCEDYARIHNGGPEGCRKSSTLNYWERVRQRL